MQKPLLYHFLFLVAFVFSALPARASHITGGEISYRPFPNDPRRYYVTARLYRDRSSNSSPDFANEITLYCRKSNCATADPDNFTARLGRTNSTTLGPTTDLRIFNGEVTLPSLGNWTLSLAEENRSFGILNLPESHNYGMYVEAELRLDPSIGTANTSPIFTSDVLPYISGNQFHRFSFSTFDADGDSLVYQMISPQGASQVAPCPRAIPVTPSPHFTINPATGELSTGSFTLVLGYYVMAARVEEYRRVSGQWIKIGSVMRDMMYRARAGANQNPAFVALAVGNTSLPLDQTIMINPGRKVELKLDATDPNAGSVLRFSSEATAILPGLSLQSLPNNQVRLTWNVPAALPLGRYWIPVAVSDNDSPINGTEVRTLTVLVTSQILATPPSRLPTQVAAYPTPFREQVQFQLSQRGSRSLTVVDGLGRAVAQLTSRPDGSVTWRPTPALAPGLYLARTADGQEQVHLLRE